MLGQPPKAGKAKGGLVFNPGYAKVRRTLESPLTLTLNLTSLNLYPIAI